MGKNRPKNQTTKQKTTITKQRQDSYRITKIKWKILTEGTSSHQWSLPAWLKGKFGWLWQHQQRCPKIFDGLYEIFASGCATFLPHSRGVLAFSMIESHIPLLALLEKSLAKIAKRMINKQLQVFFRSELSPNRCSSTTNSTQFCLIYYKRKSIVEMNKCSSNSMVGAHLKYITFPNSYHI